MDEVVFMPMIISIAFFGMVVWIVWLSVSAKNRRMQAQTEVQTKLIERFGTSKEFIEFLQSPAGQRFVSGVEVTTALYARDRIIRGFGTGIVLSLLGLGFLALWLFASSGFVYPGFILLGLGLGFVGSALVSLKLSQRYGLVDAPRAAADTTVSGS
jgi:hypothetical protein